MEYMVKKILKCYVKLGKIILDFVRGSTKIFVTLGASLSAHIIQQCLVPDKSEFKAC